jgi:hypothetical protein
VSNTRTLLVVTVVGVLALAGCGGGGSKKAATGQNADATSVVGETTTTTSAAAAGGSAGAAGGATTTVKRTTATSAAARTGAAGGASGVAQQAAPGAAATPLPAGTYRYDTTGSTQSSGGSSRPMPAVTTLKADAASGASQHTLRDLRDQNGLGQAVETVLLFPPDGVRIQSLKITTNLGGGVTDVRDLRADPPALIAKTGGGVGDHYEFTMTGSGMTLHGVITVQRAERLVIGGQSLNTAVVQLNVDFSGSVTGTQKTTAWIDPTHLLNVKEQVVSDAKAGVLTTHSEYTATLQRLQPS